MPRLPVWTGGRMILAPFVTVRDETGAIVRIERATFIPVHPVAGCSKQLATHRSKNR